MYPQSFKDLLKGHYPNNYIGQGNPSAPILIIGKECTTKDEVDENHNINFYELETKINFAQWQRNTEHNISFEQVPDWDTSAMPLQEKYNPLYPYNSWKFGKSKTWNGYQTIINHIFPQEQIHRGERYNFLRNCFITELSTYNMPTSHKNDETLKSINARLFNENGILRHEFFQAFPIIILACYHYIDDYNINIEHCFNQHFVETIYNEKGNNGWEFIHIHRTGHGRESRLLLHTNHAITFIGNGLHTDEYYNKLGEVCRTFLKEREKLL